MERALLITTLLPAVLAGQVGAQQESFADYWPLGLGYSWKYTNALHPTQVSHTDVLGAIPFGGYPEVYMVGADSCNHLIVESDGVTFTLLAAMVPRVCDLVDWDDVDLSSFSDGTSFVLQPDSIWVLRRWENLDHDLTGIYGLDPTLTDVVVMVNHDTDHWPNDQNVILESGGGMPIAAAVTDIEFFQKNLGPIRYFDVDAKDGKLGDPFEVVASFDCNGTQIPDHTDIDTGTSEDLDENCIPDECECLADLDRSGDVGFGDLLAIITAWGACEDCPEDLDGNDDVGFSDLLLVLFGWGPCP